MRNVEHKKRALSLLVVITFVMMIAVNIVANLLPLNNMTTMDVSNLYKNLFTPAEYTFWIWILIYIMLAKYSIYQFNFNSRRPDNNDRVVRKANTYFIITNFVYSLWIVLWHYDYIQLAVLLMVVLFVILFIIRANISHRSSMSRGEITSIQWPFSIYFAWITVVTLANVSTYFAYSSGDMIGYNDVILTIVVLLCGLLFGIAMILKFQDVIYGIVLIWAYFGILFKHISSLYLEGVYSNIVITLIVCITVFSLSIGYVLLNKASNHRKTRR